MIRPRTVFRSILSILLTWCVLAFLFAALPFIRHVDDGTNYATSVLSSGGSLTRVYEFDDFFPPSDGSPSVALARECSRFRFALTFSVSSSLDTLTIGESHSVSLLPPDGLFDAYSEPIIVAAPAGDMDGINPPWFDLTDAMLLFYVIHGDLAALTLRTRWTEQGALEVWPDATSWGTRHSPPSNMKPLISIKPAADDKSSLSASTPPPPLSSSPTKTYPLRRILLLVIAPTGILLLGLATGLGSAINLACHILVVVFHIVSIILLFVGLVWLAMGRPPVGDFTGNLRDSGHEAWRGARRWVRRRRGEGSISLPTVRDKEDPTNQFIDAEKVDARSDDDVVVVVNTE